MRRLLVAGLLLGGCHLADSAEPPTCPPGTKLQYNQCVTDLLAGPAITIGSCTLTPASLTVAVNGEFRFTNHDTVDHTITGDDGTVWGTAKVGLDSPVMGITKAGTWRYHVSDCPDGGAIVVE